ncbi:unnamed protein product, partial [Allacma fusca]
MGKRKHRSYSTSSESSSDLSDLLRDLAKKLKKKKKEKRRDRSPKDTKHRSRSRQKSRSKDGHGLNTSKSRSRSRSRSKQLSHSGRRSPTISIASSRPRSADSRSSRSRSRSLSIHAPNDTDLNEILGSSVKTQDKPGNDLVEPLISVWTEITSNGMGLKQAHPVPQNCTAIAAPVLNLKVQASIAQNTKLLKKEGYFVAQQQQLACGLSAVGTAIGSLVHVGVKDG